MSDMTAAIIPKSDQLNSDDLIAGPLTITITDVAIRGGQEQPVSIHFEDDRGKPYKPCKSMSRVLVSAWGADAKKYVGRALTLYRDPSVKWAGMDVGGIRISHMSDIDSSMTMALTATKGSRKPFTVRPLKVPAPERHQPSSSSSADGAPAAGPDWTTKLTAATTLDELAATWQSIPKPERTQYTAAKDARKAELTPAKDSFVADYNAAEQ